jgi:hypothetical protein
MASSDLAHIAADTAVNTTDVPPPPSDEPPPPPPEEEAPSPSSTDIECNLSYHDHSFPAATPSLLLLMSCHLQ